MLLSSTDVLNDVKLGMTGKMSGRRFTLSWFPGDESATTFKWYCK
jgi:hypothetical protein